MVCGVQIICESLKERIVGKSWWKVVVDLRLDGSLGLVWWKFEIWSLEDICELMRRAGNGAMIHASFWSFVDLWKLETVD